MNEQSSLQSPTTTKPAVDDVIIVTMSAEMVRKAARVHIETLADSRTASMGASYVGAYIDWFRQAEHGGIALAAIDRRGEVVGYVIGAPLGYPRALSRHLRWVSAAAVIMRPWLFFRQQFRHGIVGRAKLLLGRALPPSGIPELPAPTASLVALGVLSAARGKKIGLRLVQAFETKARELQLRSLRLSTRSDNTVACRLYERCGWQPFLTSNELTYYFRILGEHSEALMSFDDQVR